MRPQAALFSGGAGLLLLLLVSYCASPRIGLGRGEASIAMADEGSPEFSNWVAKWYGDDRSQTCLCGAWCARAARRAGPLQRVSSPVTQELEACDAPWRKEPRGTRTAAKTAAQS